MKRLVFLFAFFVTLTAANVQADDINHRALKREGFDGVSDVIKEMTPEQREELLRQAKEVEKELKEMTPAERRKIKSDLKKISKSLDYETVDVEELDPATAKDLEEMRQDFNKYMQKKKIR